MPTRPPQHQPRQPGIESEMRPRPQAIREGYRGSGKLGGKVAIVTGGDSGIGRAVAILFAREGADVAIAYFEEHGDAEETKRLVEDEGRRALLIAGDLGEEPQCREVVKRTLAEFGEIHVLVNNAAEQHERDKETGLEEISVEELERVFRTNIFSFFHLTKAALPHLKTGAAIVNSTSVTAYKGSAHLIDYAATKGAIVSFTRSLAEGLVKRGVRVNAVAPGPVWTPLIPASFEAERVAHFGESYPMGRPAEPAEIAPSYVFLACDDSSYMTGQVLHPNGGEIVNG